MSDELYDLVGLDEDDHEAVEAVADAAAVSDLITTLVAIRKDAGLTQRVIAERMGTTQSAVSEIERVATDPHISTLQRLGRAVGARIALKVILDGGWTRLSGAISADASIEDEISDPPTFEADGWKTLTNQVERTALRVVC